jgi:hypothetical protein
LEPNDRAIPVRAEVLASRELRRLGSFADIGVAQARQCMAPNDQNRPSVGGGSAPESTGQRIKVPRPVRVLRAGICLSLPLLAGLMAAVESSPRAGASSQGIPGAYTTFNVVADTVTYRGRRALHVVEAPNRTPADTLSEALVILPKESFSQGTIEGWVAGVPRAGAGSFARGFIGLAFHVQPDTHRLKAIFIRPTNGRADDQLRRNHATQYVALPDYPWYRLRAEQPGMYESYVDLEAGAWTRMKVVVTESRAELYIGQATQPALVVNDLKNSERNGVVALWLGAGTEGYFADVKITSRRETP